MLLASTQSYQQRSHFNLFFAGAIGTGASLYFMKKEEAECAAFKDKIVDAAMDKINKGVAELI